MFSKGFPFLILAASALSSPIGTELETRQSCSTLQLVHLAATTEIGLGLLGTPLSEALASAVPGTTTKSIPYITVPEYLFTVADGAKITKEYLESQSASCPTQRFVLSGYSKGALVLHNIDLPSALKSKVAAILVFGDPGRNLNLAWPIDNPSANMSPKDENSSSQNIASFCNTGDIFCDIPGYSLPAHLTYHSDGSVQVAADFVKARA